MPEETTVKSKSAQEIIGTVPSIITKWGSVFMISFVLLLIVSCFYIRYPEIIESTASVKMLENFSEIKSNNEGRIVEVLSYNKSIVHKNKILLIIRSYNNVDDTLKSNKLGKIYYQRELLKNLPIQKNELLMIQAPIHYKYEFQMTLPVKLFSKIELKQLVAISFPHLTMGSANITKLEINFISPIEGEKFYVSAILNESLTNKLKIIAPDHRKIECKAQIILDNKSIAQKLFSRLVSQ